MNRRAGISLAEVLIAIFVLALSLLGVLSLFPLGAVRMAQAIKDDRTATVNQNTTAMFREYWREETNVRPGRPLPRSQFNTMYPAMPPYQNPNPLVRDRYDPLWNAMENPNYPYNPDLIAFGGGIIPAAYQSPYYPAPLTAGNLPAPLIRRNDHLSSYCVFVDPIGWNAASAASFDRYWVGGNTQSIPRRSLRKVEYVEPTVPPYSYVTAWPAATRTTLIHRYFVMMDDIGFGKDGTPSDSSGNSTAGVLGFAAMAGQIQRDGYYNCALLLKRGQNNIITEADATIVVYRKRSMDSPPKETVFTGAIFVKGSNELILTYAGNKPDIRKGRWILDATMMHQAGAQWVAENDPANPHGIFYRIVGVREDIAGVLTVELQEPAAASTFYANNTGFGIAILMDDVSEVFPGRTLTDNVRPVP